MYEIEFDSVVQERSIPLPQSMPLKPGQAVRVVVMYEGEPQVATHDDAIARLTARPRIAPDFAPLSRDEAHER